MKVVFACDHGGFILKKEILETLSQLKIEVEDLGCHSLDSVHYPDFAAKVALKISQKEADFGILVCGTGIGMSIAANKFKGVRAAMVSDIFSAEMTRAHNHANVLCLGGRVTGAGVACEIVKKFLLTKEEGNRHQIRTDLILKIEKENFK